MPSLSYKERFCQYVAEGSKTQTIRAFRKYPFRVGQTLSHFFGLRTKQCRKLRDNTICTDVKTIYILKSGAVFIGDNTTELDANENLLLLIKKKEVPGVNKVFDTGKNILAWADGFRQNDDPTQDNSGCWDLLFDFWEGTHSLPFTGQIIYWKKIKQWTI